MTELLKKSLESNSYRILQSLKIPIITFFYFFLDKEG